MGRQVKDARLDNREARLKLKPKHEPYWRLIYEGLHLGYRKGPRGGIWLVRMLHDGRYKKKVLGKADDVVDADGRDLLTFRQAQDEAKELAAVESDKRHRGESPEDTLTVAAAAAHYLAWYKEHRKAYKETEATVKAHILPTFSETLVKDLQGRDIKAWLNKLASHAARKRTRTGTRQQYRVKDESHDARRARMATANRILTVFKAMLNKAFHDELVRDDNAWRKVKPFPNADEPVTRFLTEAESSRLVNASRADLRQMIKAALFTGARYNELASLLISNVNTDTATIYFKPSKGARGRHVPVSDDGLDFFKSLIAGRKGRVFLKENGEPWGKNHQTRLLQEACDKAKIEPRIGFHELRHTYASHLAQAGVDLLTISKLLGHADTRITSRHYAHLSDKTLSNAVRDYLPSFGHKKGGKVSAIR